MLAHRPGNETSGLPFSLLSPALDVLRTAEVELRRQNVQLHEGGGHMTVTSSNNNSRLAGCLMVSPRSQITSIASYRSTTNPAVDIQSFLVIVYTYQFMFLQHAGNCHKVTSGTLGVWCVYIRGDEGRGKPRAHKNGRLE